MTSNTKKINMLKFKSLPTKWEIYTLEFHISSRNKGFGSINFDSHPAYLPLANMEVESSI